MIVVLLLVLILIESLLQFANVCQVPLACLCLFYVF